MLSSDKSGDGLPQLTTLKTIPLFARPQSMRKGINPSVATPNAKNLFPQKSKRASIPFQIRFVKTAERGYYKRVEDDECTTSEGGQPRDMRREICDERKFHIWSNLMEMRSSSRQLETHRAGYLSTQTATFRWSWVIWHYWICQFSSMSKKRFDLPNLHNVIDMIAKCNEKVKEKFAATLHFCLHGSAPLKCLATSDNQSQVMSAEARVRVWRVVIGIPSTAKNHSDLDSTLQTLLPEGKALELLETVSLSRAVYDCISQEIFSHTRVIYCSLDGSATTFVFGGWCAHRILEFPRVSTLIVDQAWIVVALLH